ncbi:hypothetical protein HZY86_06885 [Aerococcaceae bacterium DSM 111020]|nr:hypothetical protein [Aerococcaceae bacterium DSM 111020]
MSNEPILLGERYEQNKYRIKIVVGILFIVFFIWLSTNDGLFGLTEYVEVHLDDMKNSVLAILSISTLTSTLISALPGDMATPLAENIAGVADYLLLVFGGIWLQRYVFLSFTGVLLRFVIPLGIGSNTVANVLEQLGFDPSGLIKVKKIEKNITIFSLATILIVPTTIFITSQMEETYQEQIQTTINQSEETQAEVNEVAIENESQSVEESTEENQNEEKNLLEQASEAFNSGVDNLNEFANDAVGSVTNSLTSSANNLVEQTKTTFNNLIDTAAMLIIVNCIIPMIVYVFLIWLMKALFRFDLEPSVNQISKLTPNRKLNRKNRH